MDVKALKGPEEQADAVNEVRWVYTCVLLTRREQSAVGDSVAARRASGMRGEGCRCGRAAAQPVVQTSDAHQHTRPPPACSLLASLDHPNLTAFYEASPRGGAGTGQG